MSHTLTSSDRSLLENVRELTRERIGFVSQDVVIFKGSLRQNLCLDLEVSDKKY